MNMPPLGLGTWPLKGEAARAAVREALALGYRHVDTAQMYENEAEVGAAIRESGLPRDEVFVVTKIHPDRFADGTAVESAARSAERLGLGPVDLMLAHWPGSTDPARIGRALAAVVEAGHARAVGVSNFNPTQMRKAAGEVRLVTNQVEFHPLIDQSRLLSAARDLGITLTAYRPLLKGEALALPTVREVAAECGRPASAVVLRWILQQGVNAVAMSTRRAHLAANLEALEFALSDDQMRRIGSTTARNRRFTDIAAWQPDWEG